MSETLKTIRAFELQPETALEAKVMEVGLVRMSDLRKEAIKRINNCKFDTCETDNRCIACDRDMWFNGIMEEELE